ncbi:hypothetical protein [Paenarthrobacter sp. YJN-5]|uniref:hypothetical protein n=1 Tax=Paenarthrobacter sp. YJN-5 TaxID=2735316 RepID=UPI001878E7F0|nr:hypothetical protein [Paenarthrobacter sp. YJN-5]QOT16702.1 hypothetical protein HMI59_08905 [Paenarthrobacter sp. YJN-5]
MKKVKYTEGLVKRTAMAKTERLGSLSVSFELQPEMKPITVDHRVIAEQVAASMAIEDRAVQSEDIVVKSTQESRKAVAEVLAIRLRDRDRRWPPDDAAAAW